MSEYQQSSDFLGSDEVDSAVLSARTTKIAVRDILNDSDIDPLDQPYARKHAPSDGAGEMRASTSTVSDQPASSTWFGEHSTTLTAVGSAAEDDQHTSMGGIPPTASRDPHKKTGLVHLLRGLQKLRVRRDPQLEFGKEDETFLWNLQCHLQNNLSSLDKHAAVIRFEDQSQLLHSTQRSLRYDLYHRIRDQVTLASSTCAIRCAVESNVSIQHWSPELQEEHTRLDASFDYNPKHHEAALKILRNKRKNEKRRAAGIV